MDLSGCSFMELDPESLAGDGDGSPMDFDHVGWQGSQTANHALNQLIRSSVNDPALAKENVDVNGSSSRGWQREPSFDQIPGFSLLSTKDSSSGNLASSSKLSSTFQTPQPLPSSRPSIARSRPSETKSSRPSLALAGPSNASLPPIASPSSPSSLSIPFFDKTNPSQFLDILKGVSARVDANAGVRPRSSTGGIDTLPSSRSGKARKRPRGTSLGGASDSLTAKIKKGRIEALRESAGVNPKAKDRDKGKGRVRNEVEDVRGGVCGDNGSAQRIIAGALATSLRDREETDGMDVDNGRDEWTMVDTSGHSRDNCNSSSTSSQTKMPPPPVPVPLVKHPSTITSRPLPVPIASASTASSSSSSAISRPTFASHSTHIHKEPISKDIKPPNASQTPKYHPLLLQPPAKPAPITSLSSHSHVRQSNPQPKHPPPHVQATSIQTNSTQDFQPKIKSEPRQGHVPPPAPAGALPQTSKLQRSVTVAIPSPSPAAASAPLPIPPSTSQMPSSQFSRPPALGMRRTHTLPSSSSAFSSSSTSSKMVPSLQKNGVLPTKQRGFKPPLLSSSQPQAPSQSQSQHNSCVHPPVKNSSTTTRTNVDRVGGGKAHIQPSKSHNAVLPKDPTSSNGSSSSASDSPQSRGGGKAAGPPSSSLSRSTSNSPASSSGASSNSVPPSRMAGSRDRSLHASGGKAVKCDGRSSESPTHALAREGPPASKAKAPSRPPHVSVVIPKSLPASPPLPEPADGDPDSSFGDMSFDMDALEETMRQYD